MPKLNLSIVPVDKIPKGEDVPLDDLLDIFRHGVYMQQLCVNLDGIGLSAVQVGVPWNFFVINDEKNGGFFLNCSYEGIGEKDQDSIEGCLSLRNKMGLLRRFSVKRYNRVRVKGKKLLVQQGDPQFVLQEIDKEYNGLFSIVFQHEIDHANQILISDSGTEVHIW
jgi:peptide deformylase